MEEGDGMNLGNMPILNPKFALPSDDKIILEDFVRGLVHSPYFIQFVLNLSRDAVGSSVNLSGLINEMTIFEGSGFLRFIELTQFHSSDELFSKEFMSFIRLKR